MYVLRFFYFWLWKNANHISFHNAAEEQKLLKIAKDLSFQFVCNLEGWSNFVGSVEL